MKYAAYGLLAAFFALRVYGAIPDSAEGWYTPSEWRTVELDASYERNGVTYGCAINADGEILWGDGKINDPLVRNALETAVDAWWNTYRNNQKFEKLGQELHDLTSKSGIRITNPQTGQSYTIDFGGSIASAVSGSAGDIPATSSEEDPADNISLSWHDGKLGVSGWWSAYPAMPWRSSLSKLLVEGTGNVYDPTRSPSLLTRKPDGSVAYMPIGWLNMPRPDGWSIVSNQWGFSIAGYMAAEPGTVAYRTEYGIEWRAPERVDGASIATNEAGVASLYGWEDAAGGSIPRKGAETLEWTPPADLVDGASLAWSADRKKYEVAGAGVYAGNHANHYFGTSANGAALGWHELPNVTTNAVYGDEATISSTVGANPGVKILGLRGWNYAHPLESDPLLVVNRGGWIDYMAPSNLAASCSCSNNWENLAWWLGFNGTVDDIFVDYSTIYESMSDFMEFDFGVLRMYGTGTEYRFYSALFDSSKPVVANFTAPTNWADGVSIGMTQSGAYQIRGFSNAHACNADMGAMLSNPSGSDARTHLLLAKKTDTGELHYVPIGAGVSGGVKADGASIVTNAVGEAQLNGYPTALSGAMPYKTSDGIGWFAPVTPAVPVLQSGGTPAMAYFGGSVAHENGNLDIKGFAAAPNLAVPQKTGGSLTWQTNVTASVKVAAINNIVTTSVEWLDSAGSDGNGANAYSIRIQRGRLAVNANGEIYVAQDDNLAQYVRTTPHSAETGN